MERRALTPSGFGLELDELDLGEIDGLRSSLVEAFHESGGLLLVRDQSHLTPRQLLDFAALFGELELNEKYDPAFLLPGVPEILRIGNLKEKGTYRSLFTQADPPPLLWHSDDTFRHPQPRLLRLRGRDAPGGRRDGIRWHGCGLRGASTGDPREGRELASTPLLRFSQ